MTDRGWIFNWGCGDCAPCRTVAPMFDASFRPLIDPPLNGVAALIEKSGISANAVTVAGFVLGLGGAVAVAFGQFYIAAVLIVLNRVLDGLDGALARRLGPTDFGGYLDIVLDFIFYSAVPFAFSVYDPANGLAAAFVIFSFIGTGASFLAYAIIAAKRGISTDIRGKKSFYHLGGLTEGAETILFLMLCCLLPAHFSILAFCFGALCWVTTAVRVLAAADSFKENA